MKLTNEQLDRAARAYLKSYGSEGEPTAHLLASIAEHHAMNTAIDDALGATVASVKDLASLKAAVGHMMEDLTELEILKGEPDPHPDEARLNFLAQFWDSQASGTQPIKVLLKNVSGGLRDAIDAARNGVVGFHHMKPSVPDPDVTPIKDPFEEPIASRGLLNLEQELIAWLDEQIIRPDNIGNIRRKLMMPWDSKWNALVRDETAARETTPRTDGGNTDPQTTPFKDPIYAPPPITDGPDSAIPAPTKPPCPSCGQPYSDHIKPTMKCPT